MNIGIICDIKENIPVAFLAIDYDENLLGYVSNNNELRLILETILDQDQLAIKVKESIDGKTIIRSEVVNKRDPYYLVAINYILPSPWKILGIRYEENSNIKKVLKQCDNYLEGLLNEQ